MSSTNYVWKKSSSQAKKKPGRQALGRQEMSLLVYLGNQRGKLGTGSRTMAATICGSQKAYQVVKFVTPL